MFILIVSCCLLVVILILTIVLFVFRAQKKKQNWDEIFKQTLKPLNLRYDYFYDKLHAYGKYKDSYVALTYAFVSKEDWLSPLPFKNCLRIMGRMKIPKTAGRTIHLAFAPNASAALRQFVGWKKLEDGVFLHQGRKGDIVEGMALFKKISTTTKKRIRALIEKYRSSCAIVNDWEIVMIGRDNALKLVGGDKEALNDLDFQFNVAFYDQAVVSCSLMEAAYEAVVGLAKELK